MEFLAGIHPIVIHFPIALFCLYLLMEAADVFMKAEPFLPASVLVLLLAQITGFFAMLTGNQAAILHGLTELKSNHSVAADISHTIAAHQQWATYTLFLFLAILILKLYYLIQTKVKKNIQPSVLRVRYICILLGLVGLFFVFRTGQYGGKLVYQHGVGTELYNAGDAEGSNKK